LTLLASTSDTLNIDGLYPAELPMLGIAASPGLTLVASLIAAALGASTLNADRIRPAVPDIQRLRAGSRPGF
jgi:hypothetical protein